MNMNDKEWNEFWDNEPDEDDDDYTDFGDDIDANNDETFANASEWNEDEHEELIARDSILSHTIRPNNRTSNSSRANNNNNNRITSNNNNNNNNSNFNNNNASSSNNNHGGDASSRNYVSSGRAGWNSLSDKDLFPNLPLPRQENRQQQSTSSNTAWQNTPSASERLQVLQIQQQQLLLQRQHQEQQQLLREHHLLHRQNEQPIMQQQQSLNQTLPQAQIDSGRQILTVDELERQLLKTRISQQPKQEPLNIQPELLRRSGWSPFGGKDLFTAPDSPTQNQFSIKGQIPDLLNQALTLEQQQQLLLQQHHLLQQQQLQQMQQMALLKQQQIQQEQRFMSQNPQCFTVEELERQMIAGRSKRPQTTKEPVKIDDHDVPQKPLKITEKHDTRDSSFNWKENVRQQRPNRPEGDVRNGFEHRNRSEFNDQREHREHRNNNRDNQRDNHRDNREHRHNNRRRLIIVPPQVQLSVIDKAKSLNLTTGTKPEESLQDRMQISRDGLKFKTQTVVNNSKTNHDGVLTEKERNWLIKIQEKIQADYDDNLDQDYYYLLYFNRSSMTDEAAQKPGPGVLDRRFIPRERLLYNAST